MLFLGFNMLRLAMSWPYFTTMTLDVYVTEDQVREKEELWLHLAFVIHVGMWNSYHKCGMCNYFCIKCVFWEGLVYTDNDTNCLWFVIYIPGD